MFSHIKELFTRPSGYRISRSVRLRSSASAYFNRTPASASNRTTWTWSAWVKRGKLGAAQVLFSAGTGTAEFRLGFISSDAIEIYEYTSPSYNWQKITTAVYRDPSAWYHIELTYDTTNGTAANRIKLYVNGAQVTSFSTDTNPTSSFSGYVNSAVAHGIGSFSTGANYLDGYLTEINFVDGQALTPSSFGETNSVTGVWQPKKYGGTYGTNGFYLNFSDNSNNTATTIGKDYSGNGNNWTPNNISVTAGTTYDSMIDVPTNYADGSTGRGNYAVMNPLDKTASLSVTNANLTASFSSLNQVCFSTFGVSSGKWYWEVNPSTTAEDMIGVANASATRSGYTGSDANGWSYYKTNGNKYNNATGTAYGATYANTDIIGVALDMDAGTLTFYKNNTSQGTAFTGLTGTLFPTLSTAGTGAAQSINFGQRPFTYTPPTGFVALNTQNLPTPTISNGANYMAATLYTGNGTSQSIVNSGGFQPDLVWVKERSGTRNNRLVDSVRGATKEIYSDLTFAEATDANGLTSFNSNGYSIGSSVGYNANGITQVGWQWKAGNSSSSNTNGSITSTVSVNATAGFSVVTYTTPASFTNATVGHGLGATPAMLIVKSRGAVGSWPVWQKSLNSTDYLLLNTTDAKATSANMFNGTSSTTFTIGTSGNWGGNTTFVAYCFAAVAGYSAFGSYTGNGSTDGPFVYCGFRPRFIMIKRTDTTGDWHILDTSRDTYNVAGNVLYPNLSSAESGVVWNQDILSNGFKLRITGANENASGGTYIYAAFAESPFKLALAR